MRKLVHEVIKWRREKYINNLIKQQNKVLEEVGEFAEAINLNNREQMRMELGDIGVASIVLADIENVKLASPNKTSVIGGISLWEFRSIGINSFLLIHLQALADYYNLDLKKCIQLAHNKNAGRKGVTIDGQLIKESDLSEYIENANKE